MWKGFPVNFLKCSKKMATNAAMSTAASSVVLLDIGQPGTSLVKYYCTYDELTVFSI